MDEATLTIRFKDESSPGPAGVATTSPQYSGSDPGSVKVADQQNAITQAGGVGAMAEKNSRASSGGPSPVVAAPVPPAAALPVPSMASPAQASGDPLLPTVRGLVQADPSVTAAEIAKALGINQRQAQTLINAATVQPGGQQSPAPSAPLPVPPASSAPVPPATPPVPVPPVAPPPIAATAQQQTAGTPQAPPIQNPPPAQPGQPPTPQGPDPAHGVQQAVDAIARVAQFGGPTAGAIGQAVSGLTNLIPSGALAVPPVAALAIPAAAAVGTLAAGATVALAAGAAISAADQSRSERLQPFSPELASAMAQSNVAAMVRDMMTAREYGAQQAARTEVNTELSNASRQLSNAVNNFGGIYVTGAKILGAKLTGMISAEQEQAAWDKINEARAKTREELKRTRELESMGLKQFDPGSFLNIVPDVPRVPWDEVLGTAKKDDPWVSSSPLSPLWGTAF